MKESLGTGQKVWGGGGEWAGVERGWVIRVLSLVQGVGRAIFSYP